MKNQVKENILIYAVSPKAHISSLSRVDKAQARVTMILALLFLLLVVAGNEFRLASRKTNLEFWTVLHSLLLPIWLCYWREWDWFLWAKLCSMIPVAVIAIDISRFGDKDSRSLQIGWFTLLAINIGEAALRDVWSKHAAVTWSPLNAMTGLLLILGEIPSLHTIRISGNETHDLLWTIGVPWVLAYTIWNWVLVFNNYPYALGRHSVLLLAPIVLSLEHGWDFWFETRVYTLAFYAAIRSTFYNQFRKQMDVSDPFPSKTGKRAVQVLAFACNLMLLNRLILKKA